MALTVATPFESDAPLFAPVTVDGSASPQRTVVIVSQSQSVSAVQALLTRTEQVSVPPSATTMLLASKRLGSEVLTISLSNGVTSASGAGASGFSSLARVTVMLSR